ncbi:MAG: excinuclease ABC subunit UvrC [Nitrospirae bacterium]|nr:excinuclease ABC subunit UvrC [Nitrospirota bacterium]
MIEKLADVPERPGVYIFRDADGRVLYVGKAKGLKSRVRSYFQKSSALDDRKQAMMRVVKDLEFTVTGNELEAFILEATLIKQLRPRYNILLRDDKSYPYLRLSLNEKWPRLEVVRRVKRDGSKYYGPYVPAGDMWNLLSFIRSSFRIPTCNYSLDKRMRPCIQHQIKRCMAPCDGGVDHDEYMEIVRQIRFILEGRDKKLLDSLERKMSGYSDEMRFEEAALMRDRIRAIKRVFETQKMVAPELGDADVIGLFREGGRAAFKMFFIRNGIMTGYRQFVFNNPTGETDKYLMKNLIEQFYQKEIIPPPLIICSVTPEDSPILSQWLSDKKDGAVKITVPVRGIKRKLIGMAIDNAGVFLKTQKGQVDDRTVDDGLTRLLGLRAAPSDIGAFDISNISGAEPVGSYVYWADGDFRKDNYRHIRMDAVAGPDDYAMMKEMVKRTFRQSEEGKEGAGRALSVPDLLVIDGGKGQLEAACRALSESGIHTAVISIAKDPDRAFIPGRADPVNLGEGDAASLLLRRIRDEAHRFAIGYHKKRRAKRTFESPLEAVPGIGRNRRLQLLRHFRSLDAIRGASIEELASVKGINHALAEKISELLKKNK